MRYQWRDLRCSITKGSDGWDARIRSIREGDGAVIEKSWDEGDCCKHQWESNDSRWRESSPHSLTAQRSKRTVTLVVEPELMSVHYPRDRR
jgi:hypothetical protein